MSDTTDLVQAISGSLTTIITLGGIFLALRQYKNQQAWKRSEWVIDEVKEFLKTPLVRNALLMLDWDKRPIGMDVPGEKRTYFDYHQDMLPHGLSSTRFPPERQYSSEELYIREAFDELFAGLDRFYQFLNYELVTKDDLAPYLSYWLEVIGDQSNKQKNNRIRQRILAYIVDYKFNGAIKLLEQFGHEIPTELFTNT